MESISSSLAGLTAFPAYFAIAIGYTPAFALVLIGATRLFVAGCGKSTSEAAYTTVEHCVADGGTQDACIAAFDSAKAEHESNAPRYATREACIDAHGADQCEARSDGHGG